MMVEVYNAKCRKRLIYLLTGNTGSYNLGNMAILGRDYLRSKTGKKRKKKQADISYNLAPRNTKPRGLVLVCSRARFNNNISCEAVRSVQMICTTSQARPPS